MKTKLSFITALMICFASFAQDLTFSFVNARNTNEGPDDFYEVEIHVASTEDFISGLGQVLFNYNPLAFGENVHASGNFEFITSVGLVSQVVGFPAYGPFVTNDNTSSRVSVFYGQSVGSGTIGAPNVSSTGTTHLFSIKIKYEDITQDPMVTFATTADNPAFTGLFTTACGPTTGIALADCVNEPGVQLVNDSFDSTGADPEVTLSISEFQSTNNILVFNNANTLQISAGDTVQLQKYTIYSLTGAPVLVGTGTEADIAGLSSGLYIAQLDFDKGTLIKKFVK